MFSFLKRNVLNYLITQDYRLPGSIFPTHYDLYLHPDIEHQNFKGRVVIHVTVASETDRIILHTHKLAISSVLVTYTNSGEPLDATFGLEPSYEFLTIRARTKLQQNNKLKIHIVYSGHLGNKNIGFYTSSYVTGTGERKTIATTRFEPTYARQAFPSFDEPAMKATFSVTLVYSNLSNYHALSNMNIEDVINRGDFSEVRFARSVPMSTYLVCFLVSDFIYSSKPVNTHGIGRNFDIRVYARSEHLKKVAFALDTAVAAAEILLQYFQVEYPLPKLDMAAIPDFFSHATEHWGLNSYRESIIMNDKLSSSTWNKQCVASIIAHEMAHMWFGNLVTMMWWNDLWLNEGFARFMDFKCNNEIYPEWGLLDQFLIIALHGVMFFDSTIVSHPIVQPVEHPDQITEMFDIISFDKGAAIIRMLEDLIGVDKFKKAVRNYINNFKYRNAVTDDFMNELANLGLDFDVKNFMRTWTNQMGLPVVNVTRISNTHFVLTQKRFLVNFLDYNEYQSHPELNFKWTIPITYQTNANSNVQRIWFNHNDTSVHIEVPERSKWLKLNCKQVGYYRVNYDKDLWNILISKLKQSPQTFSIADRAHLLNDAFALANTSELSYDIALDMTMYLSAEQDLVPWCVVTANLEGLQVILRYTAVMKDYLIYARQLISKIYKEVTWQVDENNHLKNRLRVAILSTACSLGLSEAVDEVSKHFRNWLAKPSRKPNPDLREIIYYYGMRYVGDETIWENMFEIYKTEEDSSERLKLMYGLSAVTLPWLLYRFIKLAYDEHYVRRQDYFTCLENIAANPIGEPIVWDYVRENWPYFIIRFGLHERFLGRMIPKITEKFSTKTKLSEMHNFFEKYPEAGAGTESRKMALETVKYNIRWLEENKMKVDSWLKKLHSKKDDFHVRFNL